MTEIPTIEQNEPTTTPPKTAAAAPESPRLSQGIWERLKQHKVLQWTLAYAAAAYTLLHGVEMLSDSLSWPHIISRIFTLLLILGLPVVITLAWYHGAKGLQKVSAAELTIISLLGIIAGSVLWVLTRSSGEHTTTAPVAAATAAATATAAASPRTAIAVMPFANLTGDATKDYLGDGMAEELINTLTKVPGLRVPARTSTFSYKGRNPDAKQIAKDLSVGTILEGSVRSAGTTLRITAQLIDAQTDSHLWSETYDRKFTDLFKLQDDLAKAIVQALQVNLKGASPASVTQAPPTQDLEAYQLYLQGSSLADRITLENENRAIEFYQQAIARDPKFARAYVGIAQAHIRIAQQNFTKQAVEQYAAAERAARQALALDPNSSIAHVPLAIVEDYRGNRLEAEVHSLTSLSLGSNDGYVYNSRAQHLMRGGHVREALVVGRKAIELAPANPIFNAGMAWRLSVSGRDAEALKYANLAVEMGASRNSGILVNVYSDAALRAGRYAEAADAKTKAVDVSDPARARTDEITKLVYAALADPGQRAKALAAAARLYPPPVAGASIRADLTDDGFCLGSSYRYVLLGALDEAYALANQCLDRMAPGAYSGDSVALWVLWMRPFRQDPRFQAFATRMKFMEYWQQYGPPDDCDLKDGKLTCH